MQARVWNLFCGLTAMICCCSCCPRLKRRPLLPLHWQPSVVPICGVAWLQQQIKVWKKMKTLGNIKIQLIRCQYSTLLKVSATIVVRVTRLIIFKVWGSSAVCIGMGPCLLHVLFLIFDIHDAQLHWSCLPLVQLPWVQLLQLEACGLSANAAQVRGFPHWHNRSGNCVPSGRTIWSGRSRNCWSAASSPDTGVTLTWFDSAVQQHWS